MKPDESRVRIRMTKTGSIFGRMGVGDTFVVTGRKGMEVDEARVFAYRVLKREHPDENEMEWKAEEVPDAR
ncbi:MAG TPA: hypothetical protein VLC07_03195 [Solirubrobacterales bacterium]|nr:hypothetical protein [Solirubrobacterales bacterium]